MVDPSLTPDLLVEIRELKAKVRLLQKAPRWRDQTFPASALGDPEIQGFHSWNDTSFACIYRAEVVLTAPHLDYDLLITDSFGTSITSIEWQITGLSYFTGGATTPVVLASGDATTNLAGIVDVTTTARMGPEALFRLCRFDVEIKRTGGSGSAGVRLNKQLMMRVPTE